MSDTTSPSAARSHADSPSERELVLSKLRIATVRAKLKVTLLEDFQIALRQKTISIAGLQQGLHEEGIAI